MNIIGRYWHWFDWGHTLLLLTWGWNNQQDLHLSNFQKILPTVTKTLLTNKVAFVPTTLTFRLPKFLIGAKWILTEIGEWRKWSAGDVNLVWGENGCSAKNMWIFGSYHDWTTPPSLEQFPECNLHPRHFSLGSSHLWQLPLKQLLPPENLEFLGWELLGGGGIFWVGTVLG